MGLQHLGDVRVGGEQAVAADAEGGADANAAGVGLNRYA
jgi:hypothetical protein